MTTKSNGEPLAASKNTWTLGARDRDILSGGMVFVFSGVIYFQAAGLPKGAAAFPKGIAIALALSGLLLILRSWRLPRSRKHESKPYSWKLFAIAVPLWCACVWLIRPLDFFIVAPIFLAVMSWIMAGAPRTTIGALRPIVFGIAVSAAMWGVFVQVLGVSLP